jgi:glycosyltransferase involved in cell wall biosynthesis
MTREKKRVVILFSRLSDYMLSIFRYWVSLSDIKIYIIYNRVDRVEAPYIFDDDIECIELYIREEYNYDTLSSLVKDIDPHMILCSGWSDKSYLRVVSQYSGKIATIISMDNHYVHSYKQRLAILLSLFTIKRLFSHIWVPGEPQQIYAKKLGFSDEQIRRGFYVANIDNFSVDIINPKRIFTKRFIFVGRYIGHKGVEDLWRSFVELQEEYPNEWELISIGTGPLYESRLKHPKIKHLGFVQPDEMKEYISKGGVFVLPSHFEPWGVVVHEFALAAFPMILSSSVGATSQFLDDGVNGYIFDSQDIESLKEKMRSIISKDISELQCMGEESYKRAKDIDRDRWVEIADEILRLDF